MEPIAVKWWKARARPWALGLHPPPPAQGTQGTEPVRPLSAGTGVGGGMETMTPAAGSALGPGRDPSAGAQEPHLPAPTLREGGSSRRLCPGCPGGAHLREGCCAGRSSSTRADRAKLLAGGCLEGGCSTAASINLWGAPASAAQA